MMKKEFFIILTILSAIACRKPYNPPAIAKAPGYLVIEGVVNNGADSTIVKLNRTVKLNAQTVVNPESGSSVTVAGDDNSVYPLSEIKKGVYALAGLNLNVSHMYRLKVVTADARIYQSDLVPVKNSPAVDSLVYKVESNGVQISTNTHDPQNNTHYYRWDYTETYMFHTEYASFYTLVTVPTDTIVARPFTSLVYTCWLTDTSSTIVLGSSAKLSQDVIAGQPITFIPSTSEKLENLYSILLKQYALTADAYNYWQQLKKNTEQLGSIFDAEPSEISGNIHCVSIPSEPVLGYVSIGSIVKTRIFVDSRKLPAWVAVTPYGDCTIHPDLFYNPKSHSNDVAEDIFAGFSIPVQVIQPPGQPIQGYTAATSFCADCTTRGTNIKPDFWP